MKCVLTDKLIREFKLEPTQRRVELVDQKVKGYYAELRATSPGEATLYLRWKQSGTGKTCHKRLGTTALIDVGTGRQRAAQLKLEIEAGRDPRAEANAKKAVITWTEFFDQWYFPHAKQHKRSWANDEEMHRLRIKGRFGALQLNKMTRHAVQQFHVELRESGLAPATCDHYLKLIRQALNLAVDWELLDSNPVAKVKLFNIDNQVERYLKEDELLRLLAVLESHKNRTVCNAILFLLGTGARLNEALTAEWADVDRESCVWVVRATNSKSGKKRSAVLTQVALDVLDQLDTEGNSPYLFTSSRGGGRLTTIGKVWGRIRTEAGLPELRLHDLRHSFASFAINAGCTLYEVQQLLGHSDPKVTQRYAHLSKERLQAAANTASDHIAAAIKANSN